MEGTYSVEQYCKENNMQHLMVEWQSDQNLPYTPENLKMCSHRRLWWQCKEGHLWQCEVKDRLTRSSGCPYCAGKKVWRGFNDLASQRPRLAEQWHPFKNGTLKPEDITLGSERKVWWQCDLGHEWQASVENRALKSNGCPYCTGKKAWAGFNDLTTLYPKIAKQWHPTLNQPLTPSQVRPGSGKKVWWICQDGHVWEARIFSRTSKKKPGCPICAGNGKKRAEHKLTIDKGKRDYV